MQAKNLLFVTNFSDHKKILDLWDFLDEWKFYNKLKPERFFGFNKLRIKGDSENGSRRLPEGYQKDCRVCQELSELSELS